MSSYKFLPMYQGSSQEKKSYETPCEMMKILFFQCSRFECIFNLLSAMLKAGEHCENSVTLLLLDGAKVKFIITL